MHCLTVWSFFFTLGIYFVPTVLRSFVNIALLRYLHSLAVEYIMCDLTRVNYDSSPMLLQMLPGDPVTDTNTDEILSYSNKYT